MNRGKLWLGLVLTVGCGVLAWCLWRSPPPNVILITVDALRPDRLSAYGYDKHRTPNFDRLAEEGVLFENAFCDVTWTIPSMSSVMTGQYATRHGMRSAFQRLSPEMTTIAEILQAGGTDTTAIVGSYPLDSIFGLNQGFGLYDDRLSLPLLNQDIANAMKTNEPLVVARKEEPTEPPIAGNGGAELTQAQMGQFLLNKLGHDAYRPDDEVSDRAIQWLRAERHEPFFLWVHYFGPHEKPLPVAAARRLYREAPDPTTPLSVRTDDLAEQVKMQIDRYDLDVVNADAQLGRLLAELDALGLAHNTAVILHADHGQSLNEHNYFGHGRNLYDATQRIPLLMRFPDRVPSGLRVDRMVRNVDLFATIAEIMSKTLPGPTDGTSLLPLARGDQGDAKEEVYGETYASATPLLSEEVGPSENARLGYRRLGIRTPQWKLIINDPIAMIGVDNPQPVTAEQHRRFYSEELYDLRADPGELQNVIGQHLEMAEKLRATVMDYQKVRGVEPDAIKLDETSRDRLRRLGYVAD